MKIETSAEIEIAKPVETVFDATMSADTFRTILRPFGPIPGVAETEMIGVPAPVPGARRRVVLTDGATMQEEILGVDRPHRHAYRWVAPPKGPLALLVRGAAADWSFTPTQVGTKVAWVYTFELTNPLAYPLAIVVVQLFRRWMARGLGALSRLLS